MHTLVESNYFKQHTIEGISFNFEDLTDMIKEVIRWWLKKLIDMTTNVCIFQNYDYEFVTRNPIVNMAYILCLQNTAYRFIMPLFHNICESEENTYRCNSTANSFKEKRMSEIKMTFRFSHQCTKYNIMLYMSSMSA